MQTEFDYSLDNPSKRSARPERPQEVEHDGPCQLDLTTPVGDSAVSSLLKCTLHASHRIRLDPSTRPQVMRNLKARGLLVGDALREATTWEHGVPFGFKTIG